MIPVCSVIEVKNAINILESSFEMFTKKHYKKIISKLNISEDELKSAIREIGKLNPKPGAAFNESNKVNSTIIPYFKIEISDNLLRRFNQLKPDEVLNVVRCSNYESLEKDLHKKYKEFRIPQTEYFRLNKNQIEQVNIEMTKGANF